MTDSVMPSDQFVETFRPSHWNEEETWDVERLEQEADPESRRVLDLLREEFRAGEPQRHPVGVVGGNVVDGHSRVLVLHELGLPVWFTTSS